VNLGVYYAYVTPDGALLPSTIRVKPGDSGAALKKTDLKYRKPDEVAKCRLIRVQIIDIDKPEPLRRLP
jgi:hypothetical protein